MTDRIIPAAPTRSGPTVPADSLAYRPRDYFGQFDQEIALMTRVQGSARRNAIRNAIERGELDQLPPELLAAKLDPETRSAIGRWHPAFMGGEYLPRLKAGEVEIARISLSSTTSDVTVMYARPLKGRIAYRVVDEYEGSTLDGTAHRTSIRPLTMGALIDFFLQAWNLFLVLEANYENDVDRMLTFFEAESEFYPYLDERLREMVEARYPREDTEEDWT